MRGGRNPQNHFRSFSDYVNSNRSVRSKLLKTCVSDVDLDSRLNAYSIAFSNLNRAIRKKMINSSTDKRATEAYLKKYATTGIADLGGEQPSQFIDVTVAAMVKSIAGFLTIERGLDAPRVLFPYINTVTNDSNEDSIIPNIGEDTQVSSGEYINVSVDDPAGYAYTIAASDRLIPGSIKVSITIASTVTATSVITSNTYELVDNGEGNLLAPSYLKLSIGTINYATGAIAITIDPTAESGSTIKTSKYVILAQKDTPRDPQNKLKSNILYYELNSLPEVILEEMNLVTELVAEKSYGVSIDKVNKLRVLDAYINMINEKIVKVIDSNYKGDTTNINLTSGLGTQVDSVRSIRSIFTQGLRMVNTALTAKSFKTVTPSAYLVGSRIADQFRSLAEDQTFVPNDNISYIQDLIGYHEGVPVIKSHHIGVSTGYVVHKSADGNLAPVVRGIYLPITNLPEVGNFANPTQVSSGIYAHEGTKMLTNKLLQKFTVTAPDQF